MLEQKYKKQPLPGCKEFESSSWQLEASTDRRARWSANDKPPNPEAFAEA